jgi:hypothetical protein
MAHHKATQAHVTLLHVYEWCHDRIEIFMCFNRTSKYHDPSCTFKCWYKTCQTNVVFKWHARLVSIVMLRHPVYWTARKACFPIPLTAFIVLIAIHWSGSHVVPPPPPSPLRRCAVVGKTGCCGRQGQRGCPVNWIMELFPLSWFETLEQKS